MRTALCLKRWQHGGLLSRQQGGDRGVGLRSLVACTAGRALLPGRDCDASQHAFLLLPASHAHALQSDARTSVVLHGGGSAAPRHHESAARGCL